MKDIEISRTLGYPREMVWHALTDSGQLAAWLMPNDFRPEVGHRFTFTTKPAPGFDGIVRCEVLELSPPERLVISWRGGGLDTRVSFDLAETDEGTRLTLRHSGFAGLSNVIPRIALGFGWKDLLWKKLPGHLGAAGQSAPVAN
ncbi:SRPBCC family protein [Histidinibacterium lentulum]|uniref:SRPBCC domain-containing protein n=1 Tax=Histidinibacterium lentulum TaxID=2480588 RepID=A0A3N2R9J5_9RHOB|nr:SRPBCC domain-containing protein [Histidinibacterium lentulum]ROU04098.1 SRPBCC domain-containing protein [Histidinibacterium lentulum]